MTAQNERTREAGPEDVGRTSPDALAGRVEMFGRWRRAEAGAITRRLPAAAADAVLCLPYLLHRNDSTLPGYQKRPTPAGVVELSLLPTQRTALARLFGLRGTIPLQPATRPVFLSIIVDIDDATGATRRPGVTAHVYMLPEGVSKDPSVGVPAKLAAIEAWATGRDVALRFELHVVPGRGAAPAPASLADRQVLDRLYSRGVVLAGQWPLWWLVAPDATGRAYAPAVEALRTAGGRVAWDFVDLGDPDPGDTHSRTAMLLERILGEGMAFADRAMAIVALEHAFTGDGRADLVSVLRKRVLLDGAPPEALAYEAALRLDLARDFVRSRSGAKALLAAERMCLSAIARSADAEREDIAEALSFWGGRWGLSETARTPEAFRDRASAIDAHAEGLLLRGLLEAATQTFADVAVTAGRDFTGLAALLGQLREWLLRSSPRPAKGNVPLLLGGLVAPTRPEDALRVGTAAGRTGTWIVSRPERVAPGVGSGFEKLGEFEGLVPALAWVCQNGLLGPSTRLLDDGVSAVSQLAKQLRAWFDEGPTPAVGPHFRGAPGAVVAELYVAQAQVRPQMSPDEDEMVIASANWDPLNYGQKRTNQLEAVHHLEMLAGGSCVVTTYGGTDGILAIASRLATAGGPATPPPFVTVCQGRIQRSLAPRLRSLFTCVIQGRGEGRMFLLEADGRVHAVDQHGTTTSYDDEGLRRLLAQPGTASRLVLDQASRRLSVVAAALGLPRIDTWRVAYSRDQVSADVFVCDETGAVHWETTSSQNLDGQLVGLLDVLRESHPGQRRSPESVELSQTDDGRLRSSPSSHSTLRSLRKKRSLRLEGDIDHGPIVVSLGDDHLCSEPTMARAIAATATALLAQQRPGKEITPSVVGAKLGRDGLPLPPVELVEVLGAFRVALGQAMQQQLRNWGRAEAESL